MAVASKKYQFSRTEMQKTLEQFCRRSELEELPLPASLTKLDRLYVHKMCQGMGLVSKSLGEGMDRRVTVTKRGVAVESAKTGRSMRDKFSLSRNTRDILESLAPHLIPQCGETLKTLYDGSHFHSQARVPDRLSVGPPGIPPLNFNQSNRHVQHERNNLPIAQHRQRILDAVQQNAVVLVVGETGSGKSTQVPQYILEDASAQRRRCRIVCTEPRRIAALTVSERVAYERNETLGTTVGYQIRLEKALSPATLLTFCTNGIFLRSLTSGCKLLNNITHIIVDEVHERDRMSDFLLTVLREISPTFPDLHIVIMSASLDVPKFHAYFPSSVVVDVPGRIYSVDEFYLEDVMKLTNYQRNRFLVSLLDVNEEKEDSDSADNGLDKSVQNTPPVKSPRKSPVAENKMTQQEIDEKIFYLWQNGGLFLLDDFINKIKQGQLPVSSRHSANNVSPLCLAALFGMPEQLATVLKLNPDLSDIEYATNVALMFNRGDAYDTLFLEFQQRSLVLNNVSEDLSASTAEANGNETFQRLSKMACTGDDEQIDYYLVLETINYILHNSQSGAILVFLPGYEEIMGVKDLLIADERLAEMNLTMCMLHSLMMPNDQRDAFVPSSPGVRKIVLSTNIAEVSVTINDVVFVVDSGRMKERLYDGCSGVSTLSNVWISKANALQRKGRAGRCSPGVCFRLYTTTRFQNMADNQMPEMLRVPIHELCLQTRLLFPNHISVDTILSKAPDPPAPLILRSSLSLLKTIGAMLENESLTELGRKLTELSVDPHCAKTLLYAVMFRCLDPLLIIAASMSYKDPFILPKVREEKAAAWSCRQDLGSGSFSDHFVLLSVYNGWCSAWKRGLERQYCSQRFLSPSTMIMIHGIKEQIRTQMERLGYIRNDGDQNYAKVNSNSKNWSLVKAVLLVGSYPNLAFVDRDKTKIRCKFESVEISPHSALAIKKGRRSMERLLETLPTDWLIYNEMNRVQRSIRLNSVTCVSPLSVVLFAGDISLTANRAVSDIREPGNGFENWEDGAGPFVVRVESEIRVSDQIVITTDLKEARLVMNLRENLHTLFLQMLKVPWKDLTENEELLVNMTAEMLAMDDRDYGLRLQLDELADVSVSMAASRLGPNRRHRQY